MGEEPFIFYQLLACPISQRLVHIQLFSYTSKSKSSCDIGYEQLHDFELRFSEHGDSPFSIQVNTIQYNKYLNLLILLELFLNLPFLDDLSPNPRIRNPLLALNPRSKGRGMTPNSTISILEPLPLKFNVLGFSPLGGLVTEFEKYLLLLVSSERFINPD